MRYLLLNLLILSVFCCKSGKNEKILSKSSGKLNTLSVVVDNDLWEGNVGEAIRKHLAPPVDGLPQAEPLFTLRQVPPQVFTGFVTKSRTVLKIEKLDSANVKIAKNVFAKPQTVALVSGKTSTEIIQQLEKHSARIIAAFKNEELKENKRRIKLSTHKNNTLKDSLGISLKFPSAYRIAKDIEGFYWIRREITNGTSNFMVYQLPFNYIKRNDSLIGQIIKLRDSIGKKYIPGPLDGSYMVTEKAYAPYVFETIIDNKPTIETKGIWDVKNAVMAGPFINYIVEDKTNNRLLVLEGFAFAPHVNKREYMFELEAIIKSLKVL